MDKLMNAVLTKEGNTQAYALTAVRFTMGYVSGLQVFTRIFSTP